MGMYGQNPSEAQAIHMAEHAGIELTKSQIQRYRAMTEANPSPKPGIIETVYAQSDEDRFAYMLLLTTRAFSLPSGSLEPSSEVKALPERSTTSRDMAAVPEVHLETAGTPTAVALR
jgi:hypothetical protein